MSAVIENWQYYIWFIGIPVIFIIIVLWIMRPKAKKHWKEDAQIPFREKNNAAGKKDEDKRE